MDTQNLGKIIKQARLAKKMTQSEVVGDYITRNMLSQIESGAAMPSVKTLEYLCKVLDIQIETQDFQGSSESTPTEKYQQLKKLYSDGSYEEVIKTDIPEFDDEICALKARSYLELAAKIAGSENINDSQRSVEYAKKAAELAEKGLFENEDIKQRAEDVIRQSAAKLSRYYASLL